MDTTEFAQRVAVNLPYVPNGQQAMVVAALARFCAPAMPSDRVFLLNGYAGTGKTSLTGALVKALGEAGVPSVLLAPTGRAAKVFGAYAGHAAYTIHRKIYRHPGIGDSFSSVASMQDNRHKGAVFIVDEASMIGAADERGSNLLQDLIHYVYTGDNCRLILIGDTAQLPPVGCSVSPAMDPEVSAEVKRAMEADGIVFHLNESVQKIAEQDGRLAVVTDASQIPCDTVLLSAGRAPSLDCLGALRNQIRTEAGRIMVDDTMKTSVENIYACGDINGRAMLAHAAFKMGETAAENCVRGTAQPCSLNAVPSVLYTLPEAASVGLTEPQARQQCRSGVLVGRFPLSANGRSVAAGETAGFVKVIADKATGELLGVHIVGEAASEMIAEPAALMSAEVTVHEAATQIIHAHPSCAEAFAEACADALGICTHLPARR